MVDQIKNMATKQQNKLLVDEQIQCHISNTLSCGCHDVKLVSSNDRYNTNVKGGVHDLSIGQKIYGLEENTFLDNHTATSFDKNNVSNGYPQDHEIKHGHMDVQGQYNTKIHITAPETHSSTFEIQFPTYNYGCNVYQLDPVATKEILMSNPDILMKALEASNTLSLPPFNVTNNENNCNTKNSIGHDTKDDKSGISNIEKSLKCKDEQSDGVSQSICNIQDNHLMLSPGITYPNVSLKNNNTTCYIMKGAIPTLFTYGLGGVVFNYTHKRCCRLTVGEFTICKYIKSGYDYLNPNQNNIVWFFIIT